MISNDGPELQRDPSLTEDEQAAWELYCIVTAGYAHTMDFWWQLSDEAKQHYLEKSRKQKEGDGGHSGREATEA